MSEPIRTCQASPSMVSHTSSSSVQAVHCGRKVLYRTISVGGRSHYLQSGEQARHGADAAKDVLEAVTANVRLTALVEGLQLGTDQDLLEWVQTSILFLQLCRNVNHVEIHGTHDSAQSTLTEVLKANRSSPFASPHASSLIRPRFRTRTAH